MRDAISLAMDPYREQQVIRTVMALCTLAAQSVAVDVRDDMRDEAYLLVHTWLRIAESASDNQTQLIDQCERLISRLDLIGGDVLQPRNAVLAAHAAVLRLRSTLTPRVIRIATPPPAVSATPVSAPIRKNKDLGINHAKVLQVVRTFPDIRTKELVAKLSRSLSDRTVKRCLKDLVAAGALSRTDKNEEGAVMYRAALDPKS